MKHRHEADGAVCDCSLQCMKRRVWAALRWVSLPRIQSSCILRCFPNVGSLLRIGWTEEFEISSLMPKTSELLGFLVDVIVTYQSGSESWLCNTSGKLTDVFWVHCHWLCWQQKHCPVCKRNPTSVILRVSLHFGTRVSWSNCGITSCRSIYWRAKATIKVRLLLSFMSLAVDKPLVGVTAFIALMLLVD